MVNACSTSRARLQRVLLHGRADEKSASGADHYTGSKRGLVHNGCSRRTSWDITRVDVRNSVFAHICSFDPGCLTVASPSRTCLATPCKLVRRCILLRWGAYLRFIEARICNNMYPEHRPRPPQAFAFCRKLLNAVADATHGSVSKLESGK